MARKRISTAIVIAATLGIGATAIPVAIAKTTKSVTIKLYGPAKDTKITGTWSSKVLGKGTLKGTLKTPVTHLTFTTKGGSVLSVARFQVQFRLPILSVRRSQVLPLRLNSTS